MKHHHCCRLLLSFCLVAAWPLATQAQVEEPPEEAAASPAEPTEDATPEAPAPPAPGVPGDTEEPIDQDRARDDGASTDEEPGDIDESFGAGGEDGAADPVTTEQTEEGTGGSTDDDLPESEGGGVRTSTMAETIRCHFAGLEETDSVFSIHRGPVHMSIIGSIQLLGVPFIQDPWASLEAGSIANAEGFRLRRARLGFEGTLSSWLHLVLMTELGAEGADILDANMTFTPHHLARITAGALKVPFSRTMMLASEYQSFLQRPYAVRSIAPDRSLGLQVSGTTQWVSYYAGIFNGGGDYYRGDNNDGMLYAARVEVHPLGPLPAGEVTLPEGVVVQAAGSYFFNQDATGDRHAATGELILRWSGLTVQGELLWSRFMPSGNPLTLDGVEYGNTEQMGWFAEASYFVLAQHLQVAVRYDGQLVSEAVEIRDLNDMWGISGAINAFMLQGRLKLSLVYEHRHEWFDTQVANDYLALQLQGRL